MFTILYVGIFLENCYVYARNSLRDCPISCGGQVDLLEPQNNVLPSLCS